MVKTIDGILSLVLEDFVGIGMQYFFFEKYQFFNDTFANINAGFMVVKTFELFMRPILSDVDWKEDWKECWKAEIYWSDWIIVILIIVIPALFLNCSPISRAYGAIHQSTRGNAIVRVSHTKKLNKNKTK